ncbi:hypothetical protein CAEBREN_09151 [Caenorhabditis brenneri]|uniref:SET domain-containing protein n=1 Tax=Caenorhabditis brenneri TaxID=135651 RepID=G0MLN3_CAEBE|nr:hypothetical protein CAEBREN_09151 [Caenorhabditis brenneri]
MLCAIQNGTIAVDALQELQRKRFLHSTTSSKPNHRRHHVLLGPKDMLPKLHEWTPNLKRKLVELKERKFHIDCKWQGNISRTLSHSCVPNLECLGVFRGSVTSADMRMVLYSLKNISPGEQLTVDYGDEYLTIIDMKCHCQTVACRMGKRNQEGEAFLEREAELHVKYPQPSRTPSREGSVVDDASTSGRSSTSGRVQENNTEESGEEGDDEEMEAQLQRAPRKRPRSQRSSHSRESSTLKKIETNRIRNKKKIRRKTIDELINNE